LIFDNVGPGATFIRPHFHFNRAGNSSNGNLDAARIKDATITCSLGLPAVYGRYSGRTEFIETGAGVIQATPGPPGPVGDPTHFKVTCGHVEDSWAYTTGGVRTVFPADWSRVDDKPIYRGSAIYDPASIALGVAGATQTMTVTGVVLGDRVTSTSFSQDLAGTRIIAWVSAADTVSYYFFNEKGANPLDLASGTVRVMVLGG
jgi:hypothetical protein